MSNDAPPGAPKVLALAILHSPPIKMQYMRQYMEAMAKTKFVSLIGSYILTEGA